MRRIEKIALGPLIAMFALETAACGGLAADGHGDSGNSDASGSPPEAVPPSCAPGGPGMTDCGASRESCCTSPLVQGGTFFRTYGGATDSSPATVSDYRLDKYLVTVGRFRQFVKAWNGGAGYVPPAGSGKHAYLNGGKGLANGSMPGAFEPGWAAADDGKVTPTDSNLAPTEGYDVPYATWTSTPGDHETLPINEVSWYDAYAFCIWDGGFLPSNAEWEYAAAGGSDQRPYPWGSTQPGRSNEYAIYAPEFDICDYPDHHKCRSVENIAPVGTATRGGGRWGQLDLVGELAEWMLDFSAEYSDPCVNCAYLTPSPGADRASVGNSFGGGNVVVTSFEGEGAIGPGRSQGFRCARAP
jgi:formylglycine-generating enzyme required for sulfatase activity